MGQPGPQRFGAALLSADSLHKQPRPRSVQAFDEIGRIRVALLARGGELFVRRQPVLGHAVDDLGDQASVEPRAQSRVGGREVARERQEHVVGDLWEGTMDALPPACPAMMHEQRRTVVDQPHALVTHEQIRIARRAVDVGQIGVQPHDVRRELGRQKRPVD